jgi:hypothetical protein
MLKKLFNYFSKKKISKNSKDYTISISLSKDDAIDIGLSYPNLDSYDISSIPDAAEICAELLIYINSPILHKKTVDLVEKKSNNTNNIKEKLFFDNVLSFYDILIKELQKVNKNSGPLIRPTSVFRMK